MYGWHIAMSTSCIKLQNESPPHNITSKSDWSPVFTGTCAAHPRGILLPQINGLITFHWE